MAYSNQILTRHLMAACDAYTIDVLGVPSQTLMERAAQGVVDYLLASPHLCPQAGGHASILCGSGNNGGDGFAVARFLHEQTNLQVSVCYTGKRLPDGSPDTSHMSTECARQYTLLKDTLVPIFAPAHMKDVLDSTTLVVDAMLGIGLDRDITGELAQLIGRINQCTCPILAVDIPTGVCADTGRILGCCVHASATVTMQAIKQGMLLYPAAEACGDICICDIGVDLSPAKDTQVFIADKQILPHVMPPRHRRTHKGTYGQIALICGSEEMCGAAILCAKGALASGVGLVRVITPMQNKTAINMAIPEAIVTTYDPHAPLPSSLLHIIAQCDGAVIGCGLGTDQGAQTLLEQMLFNLPQDKYFPLVMDADALNLLALHPDLWGSPFLRERGRQVVITPHPMEMARLTSAPLSQILENPMATAQGVSRHWGIGVVLKDAHTVIATPDQVFISPFGNAGMAKGGSGDVLAGILGSLLVQNRHALDGETMTMGEVVAGGVALHALSGDVAAETHGEYAMTPSDMVVAMTQVTRELSGSASHINYISKN